MEQTFAEHVSMGKPTATGNFTLAVIAGLVAAIIGSLAWMGITFAAGWHVGYVAIGVGALVGFAVRFSGGGTNITYGLLGASLTLLSCLIGELGVTIQSETTPNLDFYAILMRSDLVTLASSIISHTDAMMFVIYAVGALAAFKLSIRK